MNDTEDRALRECLLTNDKMQAEDRTQQEEGRDGQHPVFQPFEIEHSPENVPLISSQLEPDAVPPEQQEWRLSSLLWGLLKQRTRAIGFHREVVTPLDPLETTLLGESGMEESVGELMLPDVKDPHLKWPTSRKPYFFLSQTDRDNVKKDISRPTYWFLTTVLRVQAFLDEEGTLNGVNNVRALIEPAYKSTHALLILSPTFRRRRFCVLELNTFMGRNRRQPGEIKVLPALWLMNHLDHRYASGVRDMKWFVQADTRFSVDYMVRFLWPALVHELGLPKMTTEQLEGYICQYVRQHRDTDQHDISKDLVRFERRRSQEENRGDHHANSTIPIRQRRPPSLWRLLNRYWAIWAIGVFVVASVFVSMTMTADPGQFGVTHQERPKPVDKEQFPRSTLPSTLPLLFGRDQDLRQLGAYLKKPGTMAALTGGAGVGKSHCANKFALDWVEEGNKSKKRRFGFWIAAETEIEVRLGYNTILEALGVELQEADEYVSTKQLAGKVFLELTKNSDFEWIIVFDNVPAADTDTSKRGPDVIKDWFFPPPKYTWDTGRILFTTQSWSYQGRTALGATKRFQLQPLSLEDSMAMLLARLGIPRKELSWTNKKAAKLLLGKDYFDGLPIAIEAAASYINEKGITLTEYLDRMKGLDAQSRVNEAMQLVTDFARNQGNTRILDIIAFVSPNGIPLWLLGEDTETVDAVGLLSTLSILKWDDNGHVSMHRLHQIALQKDGDMNSAINAVGSVLRGFVYNNHDTWSRPTELLPHVQSLKNRFDASTMGKNATLEFSRIVRASAFVMEYSSSDYFGAKQYFQDSLEMMRIVYGQDAMNADLSDVINALGTVFWFTGDYTDAKETIEQALEMRWAVDGPDAKNEFLATLIGNLGLLLRDMGDYPGAKDQLEQSLDMMWAVYGPDAKNKDLARTINNMGMLLQDMRDYKGAKEKFEQAVDMTWAVLGPDAKNAELATMIGNLGAVLDGLGDYKGAKERVEQALDMMWAVYGPDAKNRDVAKLIHSLGVTLRQLGDFKGAQVKLEQALEMHRSVYGPDANNSYLARSLFSLGFLFEETGDLQRALDYYQKCVQMLEEAYGKDSTIRLLFKARTRIRHALAKSRMEQLKKEYNIQGLHIG